MGSESTAGSETNRQLVVFQLHGDAYGIAVGAVREIVRIQPITRVPTSAQAVIGVMNLRSRIIPIVDLRLRLRVDQGEVTAQSRIMIVESGGSEAGLLVDSVREVLTVPAAAVEGMPDLVPADTAPFIEAIVNLPDELITIVNVHRLVDTSEMEPAEGTAA